MNITILPQKYRGTAYTIYYLRYLIPREILLIIHNGSNYNFHLIIKHFTVDKFGKSSFKYLGENTQKYSRFSFSVERLKMKIKKKQLKKKTGRCIKYQMKYIDSFRSMATSLQIYRQLGNSQ